VAHITPHNVVENSQSPPTLSPASRLVDCLKTKNEVDRVIRQTVNPLSLLETVLQQNYARLDRVIALRTQRRKQNPIDPLGRAYGIVRTEIIDHPWQRHASWPSSSSEPFRGLKLCVWFSASHQWQLYRTCLFIQLSDHVMLCNVRYVPTNNACRFSAFSA
jgi:hypothetical protein